MNNPCQDFKDFPISKILIVDDEESVRIVLKKALEREGYSCKGVEDAKKAIALIESEAFDLVISDISLPGMDGVDLLKKVKLFDQKIDVILMTGHTSEYSYVDIMDAGASDYITKPFNMNSTLARIKRIAREKLHLLNLIKTNQELCISIERSNRLAMEAKEASKAKTFFLASMSHEIRTPLNGIIGYTDMLTDTPLNDEQKSFLKNAKFSCEMLLSVVNDILDFSKVEAGKLTLENIDFDPEVLCFDIIDAVRAKVDESKVELLCSVADSVPGQIIGDPHRLRQILLNLVGNAVKFTQKGSIRLCIDAKKIDQDFSRLTIRVEDSGLGIAKDELKKIFMPFIQSEEDITNRYGGTGLGLAISKNIAHKMGGDVWAESIEHKGSIFYFTAVFKIAENKRISRVRPAQLQGKKILLCTITEETFKIFSHEFNLSGMKTCHMSFEQLESFIEQDSNQDFDIGIIDFGKIVNIQTLDLFKKFNTIGPNKYNFDFIACAIPFPGIADTFNKAGFKGFLPKPVSRKKLFEMISYVMGMEKKTIKHTESKNKIITAHLLSENKKHATSILLVEDNPVNQKVTNLILSKAGYMIEIASDGQEAVHKYTSDPDAYDLIFMDINMPKMDGFTATRLIRSFEKNNKSIQKIPILALTANVLDDFKLKCDEAGMDEFLTKPIKRDLVFKAILKWVNK